MLVRFEVDCARGADKNVRAPFTQRGQSWENLRGAPPFAFPKTSLALAWEAIHSNLSYLRGMRTS
jgi:hypothetical protein